MIILLLPWSLAFTSMSTGDCCRLYVIHRIQGLKVLDFKKVKQKVSPAASLSLSQPGSQ